MTTDPGAITVPRYYLVRYSKGTYLIGDHQRPAGDRTIPGGYTKKDGERRVKELNAKAHAEAQ
jgi:hypothetical protein